MNLRHVCSFVLLSASAALIAQEAAKSLQVTRGAVRVAGQSIPVYAGVKEVNVINETAPEIAYDVAAKNEKDLFRIAAALQRLYRGRLFGRVVAPFKKHEMEGHATVHFKSLGCKPGQKGPAIILGADRREMIVTVSVAGQCPTE